MTVPMIRREQRLWIIGIFGMSIGGKKNPLT
jgi:hypothetical protein